VKLVRVQTGREMLAACESLLPVDIAVMTAAVADWRPETSANTKIKKTDGGPPAVKLTANPDILATLAAGPKRPSLLIGFAAETDNVLAHATEKRRKKGCDWIVANDVSGDVMGGDRNTVHVITASGSESWPELDKTEVAARLAARIAKAVEKAA
jgi:phosphopantothenoylcysteine decarboxylase/phosphopantothenate--cysteine ligase